VQERDAKTIADLTLLVPNGQRREFRRRENPTGNEPAFYRITTAGEYQNQPLWENVIAVEHRPRPKGRVGGPVPLSNVGPFHFSVNAQRSDLADLYPVSPGIFLVSHSLAELLRELDPASVETAPADIVLPGGAIARDFKVVMPLRILDAVDTARSDVIVARDEIIKDTNEYVLRVSTPDGFIVRGDLDPTILSFVELHLGKWWWREDLVRCAQRLGLRGLRAVPAQKMGSRREIRT
jgi:hypothetical protein